MRVTERERERERERIAGGSKVREGRGVGTGRRVSGREGMGKKKWKAGEAWMENEGVEKSKKDHRRKEYMGRWRGKQNALSVGAQWVGGAVENGIWGCSRQLVTGGCTPHKPITTATGSGWEGIGVSVE